MTISKLFQYLPEHVEKQQKYSNEPVPFGELPELERQRHIEMLVGFIIDEIAETSEQVVGSEAYKLELADIYIFWMGLCAVVGLTETMDANVDDLPHSYNNPKEELLYLLQRCNDIRRQINVKPWKRLQRVNYEELHIEIIGLFEDWRYCYRASGYTDEQMVEAVEKKLGYNAVRKDHLTNFS